MKNKLLFLLALVSISLTSCGGAGDFEIHTKDQIKYLNGPYQDILKYTSGLTVEGDPLPYVIKLSKLDHVSTLIVSENEDFINSYSLVIKANTSFYNLYNMKVGTTYYYKVMDNDKQIKSGKFSTKATYPRTLFIDGVKNVRDLGFEDVIQQGLLYRGGEFDYLHGGSMRKNIREDGLTAIDVQLKIKTDIDLRYSDETKNILSPLGEDVNYVHAPMYYKGEENLLTYTNNDFSNAESLKVVFETLADINNYPVYFHCAKGKDRTGLVSYIIKGLLGQEIDDIYKDYLFSNFSIQNGVSLDNILNTYVETINNLPGDNLEAKVTYCLVNNIGITETQVDNIKDILAYK